MAGMEQLQVGDVLEVADVACDDGETIFNCGRCDQKIECSFANLAIGFVQLNSEISAAVCDVAAHIEQWQLWEEPGELRDRGRPSFENTMLDFHVRDHADESLGASD